MININIKQVLKLGTRKLNKFKIEQPILETEILLSFVLGKRREYILTHLEKKLTQKQADKYFELLERRIKGEPVAYLIGHKEFYGLDFIVNKNVLVPRPETELMIDEAINFISHNAQPASQVGGRISLIDIGTGSGCIIITLSKILESKLLITNYQLLATDIFKSALIVARQNAKLHNVASDIKFYQGDLLEPITKHKYSNLIILANLPYLTPEQIKKSPTIKYEPKLALSADRDGLRYYRKLFEQIIQLQKRYKTNITCLLEFDPRQTVLIKKLIKQYFSKAELQIKKDLAGRDRLIIIKNII